MLTLKGDHIYLRALEPEDLDFIYKIENDEEIWELSHTQTPYSKFLIKQYLDNAQKDIYEAKQLRLVISSYKNEAIGLIDIFDFDFKNKRAGIGVLIQSDADRGKGYGKDALSLLVNYCFLQLNLHQLYCNIAETNSVSLSLFENEGFEVVGLKKEWNFDGKDYTNEYVLQLINS
ncbi:GNAT family N-acetyltransferase [Winogradskyella immobilis]|uniref:GNAT family N-acetyltransferase n=1 Tax=Winogradskyella immobilis TaxID=2816852 RepID=A0ABS8EP22_9FLAO|nr:GNAT family protein [Winogradskyella immobilis]MCC1484776.1 GNAT family N-acetyltransferase [Winogradskyella immobilis]MCG0016868.1 GNAT family N-acetyltransferase [Winogradskyella immobilis]